VLENDHEQLLEFLAYERRRVLAGDERQGMPLRTSLQMPARRHLPLPRRVRVQAYWRCNG
jgi:hypothetical protein